MAATGQCSPQAEQSVSSFLTTHKSSRKMAVPNFSTFFCSTVSGRKASLGQTWVQAVHSCTQKPFVKSIKGCMKPESPHSVRLGFKIWDLQVETQIWHPVQR